MKYTQVEGWQWKPLSEIATFSNGLWKGKKGPFFTAKVLRNTNFRPHGALSLEEVAEIQVETRQFEKRRLRHGDIILERSGGGPNQPVGRVVLFDLDEVDFSFSNFTSVIRISDQNTVDPRYLHQVLNWWHASGVTEGLQSRSTGIRNLDFKGYKQLKVPLPPLEEQRQIVAILSRTFEDLDHACAQVEANLQSVQELSFVQREKVFQRPKSEATVSLGDLCEFVRGPFGGSLKKEIFKPSGFAVYEQQHAIKNQFKSFRYFVDEKKYRDMKRFQIQPGDLIMSCSGTMGKVAIVPKCAPEGIINQALLKLRTSDKLRADFLRIWMKSAAFQRQLSVNTLGAAIKNVASVKTLKTLSITLPSLSQQDKMIEEVHAIEERTTVLLDAYSRKLKDLNNLRQSFLQEAFSGELT